MRMKLTELLRVSILVAAWLVFGGAYVVDALDASYEMNAAGSDLEQALEPEDKVGLHVLGVSHAGAVETMAFCRCRDVDTNAQPHPWLFRELPACPLYQRLSSYRI